MKQYFLLLLVGTCVWLTGCNNNTTQDSTSSTATAKDSNAVTVPQVINYQLVNAYPHDPTCFTEGLEYVDGVLYESAGQYGGSDMRKTDLKTGKVIERTLMDKKYFGEGITVLDGKVYQLTYKENTGFVYDAATLKKTDEFSYNTGEGWGMTNNGQYLIYSDGTSVIHYMDPATKQQVKQLNVTDEHGAVININELELIKGYLYANQWQTDLILKIDTATGKVVARADLSDLREKTGIPPINTNTQSGPEVLNGIAYDRIANKIFITGKYWPKLLEIKLDN
jgi:glutamine cyclotransferase